ncbi:MAG TPA: type II toxin-antitoxin system HicB family antitoxin [Allosphingosinicella sp.]|nr:type II toxin-antitoxin system HicB family antitoxin [Allosphingosinicella sp.]
MPAHDCTVLARFPDVPGATAVGETEEAALENARTVLAALEVYAREGRPAPAPSDVCGAPMVAPAG